MQRGIMIGCVGLMALACQPAPTPDCAAAVEEALARQRASFAEASPATTLEPPIGQSLPAEEERSGVIANAAGPLTLLGPQLVPGQPAPAFVLRDLENKPLASERFAGKTLVISVVPSVDTPVCEAQTGHLFRSMEALPPDTVLLTVSRDLPFAQRRFREIKGYDMLYGSDAYDGSFGRSYGIAVKESGLLARSVWVIDPEGTLRYHEIVANQRDEPDYSALLAALARAAP